MDQTFNHQGHKTLCFQMGKFHVWTGTHYHPADESDIRSQLYSFLEQWFVPNRSSVGNVIDALKAVTNLPNVRQAPCWLEGEGDAPAEEIFVCRNGRLHFPSKTLLPHTPQYFTHNAVNYPYLPGANKPKQWLRFLKDLWPNDQEAISTLQEIFGYLLTPDTHQQKIFLLVGPKRSGKGTIGRVITGLLERGNVCAPTLASLSQNFGLAPLIGKQLAIIADARLGGRSDQTAIAERLLSISGEDNITIDRKFLPAWTGKLTARFFLLTNELPLIADASGALASRFILLTLKKSFYGKEDPRLTRKILEELPALLNWSIEGWERLMERGHFVQPASSLEGWEELEDLGSPIRAFVRDRCEMKTGGEVECRLLFGAFQAWHAGQGSRYRGTIQTFGRDLRAAFPEISVMRQRDKDVRLRVYSGVRLQKEKNRRAAVVRGPSRPVQKSSTEKVQNHTLFARKTQRQQEKP